MKKIVFIMPFFSLPIDASKGGAIEQLMNVLIEENERLGRYEFIFISPYTVDKKYKNTKIITIKENGLSKFIRRSILYLIRKLKLKINYVTKFDKKALKIVKDLSVDKIIIEGAIPTNLDKYNLVDRNKLYMHLHYQHTSNEDLSKYFGNLISVSAFVNDDIKNKIEGDCNFHVLKNCLTSDNFYIKISEEEKKELKKNLGFNEEDFVVIYCGRLSKEKGIDKLIEAFKLIDKENIRLMIIGESFFKGSKKNEFLKRLESECENIIDKIKFTGYIKNSKLYKYYQVADLQVVPTIIEEAAGLVALEGRACGIKQVITNSGGLKEYASDYATVINKEDNIVQNLVDAIVESVNKQQLIKDEDLKEFSRKFYYDNFSNIIEK